MWLTVGALLLFFGLSDLVWEKFGIKFDASSEWNDRRLKVAMARVASAVVGMIIVALSFPEPFAGLVFPGWFVIGFLLALLCQTTYFWRQFDAMIERDSDWLEWFYATRLILTVIGIVLMGLGIFDGVPEVAEAAKVVTPTG